MKDLFLARSWVEIDLEQIKNNYRVYREALPENAQIIAVVKANAYGHGAPSVALTLQKIGVTHFAVSNLNEAIELRECGVRGEILILGYTSPKFAKEIQEYDLTQTLVSEEHAEEMAQAANKEMKCQFAIDTGMNRIGLDSSNAEVCAATVRKYHHLLNVNGIFTHLCVADSQDEENVEFTKLQFEKFSLVADKLRDLELQYVHSMNSAGGYYHSAADMEKRYVRLGIMLYGLKPDTGAVLPEGMKMALSWKSSVSMVKTVRCGETVGYGRSYTVAKDMEIATIPTGYADGYPRALSNKGYVLIKGVPAPIVGRICMDQMMVDVSGIKDVSVGDTAVLIGSDGEKCITADDIAAAVGTIGYDIVCGISKRVNRIYKGK